MTKSSLVASALLCLSTLAGGPAAAETWQEKKCRLYVRGWDFATVQGSKLDGIGTDFLATHEAFVASGCWDRPFHCPATPEERQLADTLFYITLIEGIPGTFLPYLCRGKGSESGGD